MGIYIYKTTNNINGMEYIGKHEGSEDDTYIGSGKLLKEEIKKYGRDNFTKEILEVVDYNTWQEREKYWIEKYDTVNNGYNISLGGNGMRFQCGVNHPNFKKPISDEHKQAISKANKGRPTTDRQRESARKNSERLKGIPKSEEFKQNLRDHFAKGVKLKPRTREHSNAISEAKTGVPYKEEHRIKKNKYYYIFENENMKIEVYDIKTFCNEQDLNMGSIKVLIRKQSTITYKDWKIERILKEK